MKTFARRRGQIEGTPQFRVRFQFAIGDRLVDTYQVLVHHTAGADVQVAHFAVAHLAGRKPHVLTIGEQLGVRSLRDEPVDERCPGLCDGVRTIAGTDPPPVQHDENDFRRGHVSDRRISLRR